jgi:dTDP-4-amino-4,6-dideoxygalactose transaminase
MVAKARLAIEGGPKAVKTRLGHWPQFDGATLKAVAGVLKSGRVNYWTGPKGMEFEEEFARWMGCRFAVSTTNGTSALHVALAGLGVGPGDEVIVPSYTFIATAFSVCQAGAIPRFADVNREDHCLSVASARKLINSRTRAIIPVHLYGNICNMGPIVALAKKHNLVIIEDTAQAFGGKYKGRMAGSIGHAGAISFCQNKTFTTGGEGGMVVTDDEDLAWRCRSFRDHGYDVAERLRLLELEQKLPYIHNRVGWNYRMTEMQSAIGLCELKRVDTWNMPRRRRNARILLQALKGVPQVRYLPVDTPERRNGWYVFPITLDIERMRCDIRQFVDALGAEGAPCWRVFWPQCHTEKAFQEHRGVGRSDFPFKSREYTDPASVDYTKVNVPNAVWHERRTFVTFIFPTYTEKNMHEIAAAIRKVIAAYAK